jgi:hypothetical protein
MASVTPEAALSDLLVGLVDTLDAICKPLIERGHLDRELLIADLAEMEYSLLSRGVGELGRAVPASLSALLREQPAT